MDLQTVIQHKIVFFYYNLTRKKNPIDLLFIEQNLRELLILLKRKKNDLENIKSISSDISNSFVSNPQGSRLQSLCDPLLPFGFVPQLHNSSNHWRYKNAYLYYLKILWIMIAETRDIEIGKGERELTYRMLFVWYEFYPLLSIWMLKIIMGVSTGDIHTRTIRGIGCWKDIKHLCHYIREHTIMNKTHLPIHGSPRINDSASAPTSEAEGSPSEGIESPGGASFIRSIPSLHKALARQGEPFGDAYIDLKNSDVALFSKSSHATKHPLILAAIDIMLNELEKSYRGDKFSIVAKWVPREKTKYNWLFCMMAYQWSYRMNKSNILFHCKKDYKKTFRQVISQLNKKLDIVEIKQCSQQWSKIDPNTITTLGFIQKKSLVIESFTMFSKIRNFLYSDQFFNNISRTRQKNICNYGFQESENRLGRPLDNNILPCSKIRNIPISYYVKKAFQMIPIFLKISVVKENNGKMEVDKDINLLNKMWKQKMHYYHDLGFFIPIVILDKFQMYESESFFFSLGLSCLISEKSLFFKRILLVIHGSPHWFSFEDCPDFFSTIVKIWRIIENITLFNIGNTIQDSISLLIHSIIQTKVPPDQIEKMVLVYIDGIGKNNKEASQSEGNFHSSIVELFKKNNIASDKMPYSIYWNCSLEKIDYLPCNVYDSRVALISGLSCNLVSYFTSIVNEKTKEINQTILPEAPLFSQNMNPFEWISVNIHNKKFQYIENIFWRIVESEF